MDPLPSARYRRMHHILPKTAYLPSYTSQSHQNVQRMPCPYPSKVCKLRGKLAKLDSASLQQRLKYYDNENSPPSSDSLEWKLQKAQRGKDTVAGTGGGADRRAPGGQVPPRCTRRWEGSRARSAPAPCSRALTPPGLRQGTRPRIACGGQVAGTSTPRRRRARTWERSLSWRCQ